MLPPERSLHRTPCDEDGFSGWQTFISYPRVILEWAILCSGLHGQGVNQGSLHRP